ncbi:MAG: transglutaminase-like cysteine peptidase [Rhodospirillales bacterium]
MLAGPPEPGFSRSVTPGLVKNYTGKFGWGTGGRLGGWQRMVGGIPADLRQQAGGELKLLDSVNGFFNRLPFVSDMEHWQVDDYWASPAEMLASDGGDCEDFAIAKYFTLKELGVPIERLRITYVKAVRLDIMHMVLAYYPAPDAVPLIMDNLDGRIRPASDRPDLVPVYTFNDDDLRLSEQRVGVSPLNLRMWSTLMDRLQKELLY